LVGPYAEADATLPLRIIDKQWPLLQKDDLGELFSLESRLIPLMVAMRRAGVTIDVPFAERLYEEMGDQRTTMVRELKDLVGFEINVASGDDLKRAFDTHGLAYPLTAKGSPSFVAAFLESVKHPIGKKVVEIRQRDKLRNTFIKSYLLDNHVNNKVYCSFNQMRGESFGTRSGRFSSSDPNLQNIPSRTELGKRIREAFTHDEDHVAWRKYDYSQIEYRFLAHYAVGEGADEMRRKYSEDPNTDYHNETGALIKSLTGLDLKRAYIKNVNFGNVYGQGEQGLADLLGLPLQKARVLLKQYHAGLPFVKKTMQATQDEVTNLGFINTILGRRTYFDTWEPQARGRSNGIPLTLDEALDTYGPNIRRANTNKALNRRLQGSAADLMKKAMLKNWEDGVFAVCGVPRLTVHDELDFSDPGGVDAAFIEMKHNLETALPIRVPVVADYEIGPNWGAMEEPA
jgi:DNA polymerase-1